jgi:hypothetical protein
MEFPKVLLAAPINIVKEYCLYDWLETVKGLSYPNFDIFLVDNSNNASFSDKISSLGYNCVYEPPKGREAREFIAASMERCRIKFLAGDYDYLFSLECDIFPPKDIIESLLKHDLDVVGTTFWTDHGYNSKLQLQTIYNQHTDYENHTKEYKVRFLTFEEAQLFMDGKTKPMYGAGIGCVLIKRWVLEKITFRIYPDEVGFADSFFHKDIWQLGIDNHIDTSIIPVHKNSNWNTILSDTSHKKMQARRGDVKLNT